MDGIGPAGGVNFTLSGTGNMTIAGTIVTSGSCKVGCAGPRRMQRYVPTASAPTIEDTGEAELVGGAAFVRIDPAFANVMASQGSYYVLITPEGDTRGLYVAQRTASGFAVRESAGGRSNAQFAYRIVARPYGDNAQRLPFVERQIRHVPAERR